MIVVPSRMADPPPPRSFCTFRKTPFHFYNIIVRKISFIRFRVLTSKFRFGKTTLAVQKLKRKTYSTIHCNFKPEKNQNSKVPRPEPVNIKKTFWDQAPNLRIIWKYSTEQYLYNILIFKICRNTIKKVYSPTNDCRY